MNYEEAKRLRDIRIAKIKSRKQLHLRLKRATGVTAYLFGMGQRAFVDVILLQVLAVLDPTTLARLGIDAGELQGGPRLGVTWTNRNEGGSDE